MPAVKKRYYSTAEIQIILDCSRTKANQIMHMFERRGQLFRDGALMKVEIPVFESYLQEKTSQAKAM